MPKPKNSRPVVEGTSDRSARTAKAKQDTPIDAAMPEATFVKESLTFEPPATGADAHKTAYSTLLLQLLGAVSQFERALIKERQREGIAIAKTKKLYKGREPALEKAEIAKLQRMVADGVTKVEIAETLDLAGERLCLFECLNGERFDRSHKLTLAPCPVRLPHPAIGTRRAHVPSLSIYRCTLAA